VVDDLEASLAALRAEGVDAVGELENFVFLDSPTLPVPTFLADTFLAEDPRHAA
jgi:hypothetical protein